jgi:hypothetical protein
MGTETSASRPMTPAGMLFRCCVRVVETIIDQGCSVGAAVDARRNHSISGSGQPYVR